MSSDDEVRMLMAEMIGNVLNQGERTIIVVGWRLDRMLSQETMSHASRGRWCRVPRTPPAPDATQLCGAATLKTAYVERAGGRHPFVAICMCHSRPRVVIDAGRHIGSCLMQPPAMNISETGSQSNGRLSRLAGRRKNSKCIHWWQAD